VEFTGAEAGPHLLITGGVHGDEFEPMAAIRRLIATFRRGRAAGREMPLRRGRLSLIPIVNEGAFLRGARTASDGLDLARTCPGSQAGSVTERIAHGLSQHIRAADYYIDLHTGGTQLAVLPMTGYTLHPEPEVRRLQQAMARAFNLPIIWATSPDLPGRSLSVARDARVPAIYAEHGGGGRCSQAGVEDYVAGCLNVLGLLGMIEREPPADRVEQVIEDPRPQSGHMQVCHPAPMTGFFEPAVSLGERLSQGQLLGRVVDLTGDVRQEVYADRSGIVLVLRTFPRVKEGESLGVLVEV